jgi:hypothetical protein
MVRPRTGQAHVRDRALSICGGLLTGVMACVFGLFLSPRLHAAEKLSARLAVQDTLVRPGQPARIEAVLTTEGLLGTARALGGEQLELLVEGKVVAKAMTGGDGRAYLEYIPRVRGYHEITVRLNPSPRVTSVEAKALLGAWERRRPILLVEMAAVMTPAPALPVPIPFLSLPLVPKDDPPPMVDAADELNRLAQFFYNVIYVSWRDKENTGAFSEEDWRPWLRRHKFPRGLFMTVRPGQQALGDKVDQLRLDGWTNLKAGIGRTQAFAEVLATRRIPVVLVPEPEKGDLPKKTKIAKDWKEVRKQLD